MITLYIAKKYIPENLLLDWTRPRGRQAFPLWNAKDGVYPLPVLTEEESARRHFESPTETTADTLIKLIECGFSKDNENCIYNSATDCVCLLYDAFEDWRKNEGSLERTSLEEAKVRLEEFVAN
ncbi:hypothetical protein AGMMS49975_26360 [Clostridia bacterium]|nr:hypothetical protein AGMMS49975_26360 [Clostridia bacterium]